MKLKHALTLSVALVLSPLLRASDLPAPMPEFMDKQQLDKWCADKEAKANAAAASEAPSQFYTGKPYVADAGGYIFKYRTYNPEMARWTTADPSGFPDGVNNCNYSPTPTSQLDNNGLFTLTVSGTNPPNSITTSGNTITYNKISQIGSSLPFSSFTFGSTTYTFTPGTFNGAFNVNIPSNSPFNNGTAAGYGDSHPVKAHVTGSGNFDWIQIITSNYPTSSLVAGTVISTDGANTTYFDNAYNTSVPFYGNTSDKKTGNNPWESDNPQRSFNEASSTVPSLSWTANMYLVSVSNNTITVYGGYSWGFTLTPGSE